jgi:hypothetical protein
MFGIRLPVKLFVLLIIRLIYPQTHQDINLLTEGYKAKAKISLVAQRLSDGCIYKEDAIVLRELEEIN